MKRDIIINFESIENIIRTISLYSESLDDINTTSNEIKSKLAENNSKAVDSLISNYEGLTSEIESCKLELDKVKDLLSNYLEAMRAYVKPVNVAQNMQVDRNDVWANTVSIEDSFGRLSSSVRFSQCNCEGNYTLDTEKADAEKSNYKIIERADSEANKTIKILKQKLHKIWAIYDNKIVLFENTDDDYASKASRLYEEMTNYAEREVDYKVLVLESLWSVVKGMGDAVTELFAALEIMVEGLVCYIESAVVIFVGNIKGEVPEGAKYHFDNGNKLIGDTLKDSFLLNERFAEFMQESSDLADQKGIGYAIGGSLVNTVTKGTGKITKISKVTKVTKKVDKSKLTSDVVTKSSKKVDDVKKSSTKGVSNPRDFYRKNPSDPIRDILGSGLESNPKEWNKLINDMANNGVEIVYRDGTMVYSPGLVPGAPGQLIIDKNASMSALIHEYQHYLDDVASGLPGMRQLYEQNPRIIKELRAYMKEIKIADELGLKDVSAQLWENYRQEREYILNFFKE